MICFSLAVEEILFSDSFVRTYPVLESCVLFLDTGRYFLCSLLCARKLSFGLCLVFEE